MARTVIDIDDEALKSAAEYLGTKTKVDTVNSALRDIAGRARRVEAGRALAESLSHIEDFEAERLAARGQGPDPREAQ
ncbi:MAG: type II toxin-antitoxin system VapB family antitoxin [Solirubrobacterales bacterium]